MNAAKPKASQQHIPLLALSADYLAGCTLVGDVSVTSASGPAAAEQDKVPAPADGEDGRFHCGLSRATFDSADALREHYHTDWYRYNLKRAQRQLPPVDEAEFERLVEADALGEELSGSDSEGEAEEGEEGGGGGLVPGAARARLMLRDATGAHLLVWRAVLGVAGAAGAAGGAAGAATLDALRQLAAAREPPPVWVVVLCRGGHFAAAAFELRLPPKARARSTIGQ